ncbi:MAG: diguanylate cyclase [Lachnospiraceae bacterium]|nr:diguanylate cyclase [Lachnospiraceae bacterium]
MAQQITVFIGAIVGLISFMIVLENRASEAQKWIMISSVSLMVYMIANLFKPRFADVDLYYVFQESIYISTITFDTGFVMALMAICDIRMGRWFKRIVFGIMYLMIFVHGTIHFHDKWYKSLEFEQISTAPVLYKAVTQNGWLYYFMNIFVLVFFAFVLGYVLVRIVQKKGNKMVFVRVLLIAILTPCFAFVLSLFNIIPSQSVNYVVFILAQMAMTTLMVLYNFAMTLPAAKEQAVEISQDGIIILDRWKRFMYANHSAKEIISELKDDNPDVITEYIQKNLNGVDKIERNGRIYQLKFERDVDELGHHAGHLISISDITEQEEKIQSLTAEATIDGLTGLMNKKFSVKQLTRACMDSTGVLAIIDLDSFKLVNDIYGHDMGDKVLVGFSDIIKNATCGNDLVGRMGGDEFAAFIQTDTEDSGDEIEEKVRIFADTLNENITVMARKLMGENMNIPLGASVGAVMVPTNGTDYNDLFRKADEVLYFVKQNGKHGYGIYHRAKENTEVKLDNNNIESISMIYEERNVTDNALRIGSNDFASVYRLINRMCVGGDNNAFKILLRIEKKDDKTDDEILKDAAKKVAKNLPKVLSQSDIFSEIQDETFFILIPNSSEGKVDELMNKISRMWDETENTRGLNMQIEKQSW